MKISEKAIMIMPYYYNLIETTETKNKEISELSKLLSISQVSKLVGHKSEDVTRGYIYNDLNEKVKQVEELPHSRLVK